MSWLVSMLRAARKRWPWLDVVALSLVVSLVSVSLLGWLGVSSALDGRLHQFFYQMRGERSSGKKVLLIEIDDQSIEQWGPLPWSMDKYDKLLATVMAGGPRMVAFLEPPTLMWERGANPSRLEAPRVFVPPPRSSRPEEPRYHGAKTPLTSVPLRSPAGDTTLFAALLERLDYRDLGDELLVNYLGPGARVPLLSASMVTRHDQLEVFVDRIVLIGRADTETAEAMSTPVGSMTLAEIQAQALLSLDDDATWWHPEGAWSFLILFGYVLALLGAMYRRTMRAMFYVAIGFLIAFLLGAYLGFSTGAFLLDIADPINVTLATLAVAVLSTESEARFQLARLSHELAQHTTVRDVSREQLWKECILLTQRYTDAHSSVIAEIEENGQTLAIRAVHGIEEKDIAEANRDIGKPPFRGPILARRFEILNNFVTADLGLQTLMVPLMIGTEAVGFWALNYENTKLPTPARERRIEMYAAEITHTLADIRARAVRQPRRGKSQTLSRDNLMSTVHNVQLDARNLIREQRGLRDLTSHLPVAVAVATLWQDIVLVNEHMTKLLSDLNIWLSDIRDVTGLITRLTDKPHDEVQTSLRTVVQENTSRVFAIPQTDYALTLSWVHVANRDNDLPLARFVLAATHGAAPATGEVAQQGGAFDINTVIMEVLSILRSDTSLPQRQIRIELVYPTPRAKGDATTSLAALLVMLRDTAMHGDPEMPCMLSVEVDENQIVVTVSDATYSIPSSAVQGMLREVGGAEDTKSSLSAIKNRLEDTKTGHLDVESLYGSGIMFRLQLPLES